jgi:transposase, IS6 family
MPIGIQLRKIKHLNNIIEQDHRFIKKRVHSMLGLKSFRTATYILSGIEVMHMLKKERVHQEVKSVQNQKEFIHKQFGLASWAMNLKEIDTLCF